MVFQWLFIVVAFEEVEKEGARDGGGHGFDERVVGSTDMKLGEDGSFGEREPFLRTKLSIFACPCQMVFFDLFMYSFILFFIIIFLS